MRIVAIIQARLGSARLPGKALLCLQGQPLLEHVIQRAQARIGLDEVILATTYDERDRGLADVAWRLGVRTWFGPEQHVLARMRGAAEWAEADVVMRITADCPLWAPDVATRVLCAYMHSPDRRTIYASNDTFISGYPDGLDVEIFSRERLILACETARDHTEREHVTPGIRRLATRILTVNAPVHLGRLKLSVDRPLDFERVRDVIAYIPRQRFMFMDTIRGCINAGLVDGVAFPEEMVS